MDFILATTNKGKVKELKDFFDKDLFNKDLFNKDLVDKNLFGKSHRVLTLSDLDFNDEIIEDGTTFAENAIIKAKSIFLFLEDINFDNFDNFDYILADDSGLVVDALNGEPGVDSANWMGKDTPYEKRNKHLLKLLENVPEEERTARFITVIACCDKRGKIQTQEGILEGRIARNAAGDGGFGYDPVFFVPDMDRTLAQLTAAEKNHISHRAQAMARLCGHLFNLG